MKVRIPSSGLFVEVDSSNIDKILKQFPESSKRLIRKEYKREKLAKEKKAVKVVYKEATPPEADNITKSHYFVENDGKKKRVSKKEYENLLGRGIIDKSGKVIEVKEDE
jgi:hypothetical protein